MTERTPELVVEITVRQPSSLVEPDFLERVICRVLQDEGFTTAKISLAIVSDAEIHAINREFLGHDNPTDVISFRLDDAEGGSGPWTGEPDESSAQHCFTEDNAVTENDAEEDAQTAASAMLEGELIVSVETALREAPQQGWSPRAELLLYVVHGLLHLCGYDDLTDEARPTMRAREREVLAIWGYFPTGLET